MVLPSEPGELLNKVFQRINSYQNYGFELLVCRFIRHIYLQLNGVRDLLSNIVKDPRTSVVKDTKNTH